MMMVVAFVVFASWAAVLWCTQGCFVGTQEFKYPPRLYYMAFAFAVIILLWLTRDGITSFFKRIKLSQCFAWIGSHTIWIYFWHIIALNLVRGHFTWTVKFLIVFTAASLVTLLQNYLVGLACKKTKSRKLQGFLKLALQ